MTFGLIKNNVCINIAVFPNKNTAEEVVGLLDNVDFAVELPDGFGINDIYIDGIWTKNQIIEQKEPTLEERITAMEMAFLEVL